MTYSPYQVSIVLADDHPVVLKGLSAVLRAQQDMTVLASSPDGSTAIEAIRGLAPDIALLDIAMPDLNGIQVLVALALDRVITNQGHHADGRRS